MVLDLRTHHLPHDLPAQECARLPCPCALDVEDNPGEVRGRRPQSSCRHLRVDMPLPFDWNGGSSMPRGCTRPPALGQRLFICTEAHAERLQHESPHQVREVAPCYV